MSIDLDFIKKTEELLKKQEEYLEELKLFNETLKNCKFDSSFIDEFLEKHEEELEELEEFKNLPLDEKVRMLEERNSEKAE